jgi:hypothetical protein
LNFKTSKQSYKSKKVSPNKPEDWLIFENTHEPIVEESVFLIVQNLRKHKRRPTKKYTNLNELDATVLRKFIDRIYVSAVDRSSKTMEIEIVYNFIGAFDFKRVVKQTEYKKSA